MTDDELDAKLFDYYEGNLPPEERAAVEKLLAARGEPLAPPPDEDEKFRSGLETLKAHKAAAPETFTKDVTETIHLRSAGRFFARRTFGDRVPFGVVLALALVIAIAIAAVLWSSSTGSLRVRRDPGETAPPPGARDVLAPPEP
jgi:anti-sigma factor RsiW